MSNRTKSIISLAITILIIAAVVGALAIWFLYGYIAHIGDESGAIGWPA